MLVDSSFRLGCDPEVFAYDDSTKHFVPCIGLLGGNKEFPRPLEHCAVQEDNVMAEFNIVPVNTEASFLSSIKLALLDIRNLLKTYNLSVAETPAARFLPKYMQDYRTQILGCNPDWLVYSSDPQTPSPITELPKTKRYGAGHLHISQEILSPFYHAHDNITYDSTRARIVGCLDQRVGIYCHIFDKEPERKKLYGQFGRYRNTFYGSVKGVEYRTPSNFWIFDDEHITNMFFLVALTYYLHGNYNSLPLPNKSLMDVVDYREYGIYQLSKDLSLLPQAHSYMIERTNQILEKIKAA